MDQEFEGLTMIFRGECDVLDALGVVPNGGDDTVVALAVVVRNSAVCWRVVLGVDEAANQESAFDRGRWWPHILIVPAEFALRLVSVPIRPAGNRDQSLACIEMFVDVCSAFKSEEVACHCSDGCVAKITPCMR